MAFLTELWLPILLATVFVFIASSVIHMALPYHKKDCAKMDGEEQVLEAMRSAGVKPGAYMFPMCGSMKDWNSDEMKAKREKGPQGIMTVVPPGGFNMGKSLVLWFMQSLIVSFLVAYIGWHSIGATGDYLHVFRIVGASAFLAYAIGNMHDSIWKGQSWVVTGKFMFDGLVYALLTAGTFGWLWPTVEAAVNGAPAGVPG